MSAHFAIGDLVQKKRGSAWRGRVVGFYSTAHTEHGYSVESLFEPGSVQVWPEAALEPWDGIAPPVKSEIARRAREAAQALCASGWTHVIDAFERFGCDTAAPLLAEIERLRAERDKLHEALAEVFADHGAVNRLSWIDKAAGALAARDRKP